MHEHSMQTRPTFAADVPEWGFPDGMPQLVVAVPNGDGTTVLVRLDQPGFADLSPMAREFARGLIRLAMANLDATEPVLTAGLAR